MVKSHDFREDLYYRLNVAKICVPPLRERKEDIPSLVKHLLKKASTELGKGYLEIDNATIERMIEYDWPGNVRELENIILRAAVMAQGDIISKDIMLPLIPKDAEQQPMKTPYESLQDLEKEYINKVLSFTGWHITKTAQILGISRPTLRAKIRQYKLGRNGQ